MRRLCLAAFLLLPATTAPSLVMAGPPTLLYGKSVSYRWMEDIEVKFVNGRSIHRVISQANGMHISTAGRIFSQSGRMTVGSPGRMGPPSSNTLGAGVSRDPEGGVIKSNVRYKGTGEFKGHTLTKTMMFESGARRVTVNFDESFRTCTVDVVYGKENGAPGVVAYGLSGRLTLSAHQVSGQNCTISDGNMFGSNSE
jgi:hypothetical protein